MKKIINGKMYDTKTAELIDYYNDGFTSDLYWVKEMLFKKKTGEFFIYRETRQYGAELNLLSIREAKDWVEENSSADIYEELFGKTEE
jgi:hypothetical protein